jgi:hypothetical protein
VTFADLLWFAVIAVFVAEIALLMALDELRRRRDARAQNEGVPSERRNEAG